MQQPDRLGERRETFGGLLRFSWVASAIGVALVMGTLACGPPPLHVVSGDPIALPTPAAGDAPPTPPSPAADEPGSATADGGATAPAPPAIELHFAACRTMGPAYRLTVEDDGRVGFEGERNTHVSGKQSGRIAPAAVQALLERARQAGFAAMAPHHACVPTAATRCSMHPCHASLRITLEGETHQVTWSNEVAGPPSLHGLVTDIERVTNSAQWVSPGP